MPRSSLAVRTSHTLQYTEPTCQEGGYVVVDRLRKPVGQVITLNLTLVSSIHSSQLRGGIITIKYAMQEVYLPTYLRVSDS